MAETHELGLLAGKLDALFRAARPGGRRRTNDEVASELKRSHPDLRVSGAYLSALRTGKRARPSPELQVALARFFGVAPSYFFDPDEPAPGDPRVAELDALREAGVRALALRAVGLSPESLRTVTALLDQVRRQQGLPVVRDLADS